jgi:aminopeptidase N
LIKATHFPLSLLAAGISLALPAWASPEVPPRITPATQDVAPYLSYYKSRGYTRALARARAMTANQEAFDVHYYSLDLSPDPVTEVLTGTVSMTASVTMGPLATLELDLEAGSMTVDAVSVGSLAAGFTHMADVLTVQLDRAYGTGEAVEVTVQYHGTPASGDFVGPFVFDTHNGSPMIWTLSEPFGARAWWPCKDQPADKADSVDVRVTVPTGMITASNGTRIESTDNGTTAVTRWRERYPIAPYLVSIASFAYATHSDWFRHAPDDSMEIQFFEYPENVAPHAGVNALVKSMMAAFTERFGAYPFLLEKYGQAEFPVGGGMEHQTCTSLGVFHEYVVAHELAHQWWGDDVTCRDFHHIWLNEGFATYGEALWVEAHLGPAAYHVNMNAKRYLGPGTIYVPDVSNPQRIFNGNLSYRKASWVLHMLRHVLGDETFFTALRTYGEQFAYGTAVTEDFQQVCESVSGMNLSRFFQQWIHGEYYPYYRVSYASEPAETGYDVHVQIDQQQLGQVFWMPIDIVMTSAGGDSVFVAMDSLVNQNFTFRMPQPPTAVVADPDQWILREITYTVDVDEGPSAKQRLELLPPQPNPSAAGIEVSFVLSRRDVVQVHVLDAAGRRVADLLHDVAEAGPHRLFWDGRGREGRRLQAGIYWVSIEQGRERRARKLAIVH